MAITVDSIAFAIIASLLLSSLFTLSMVFVSYKGINNDATQLLNRTAKGSPYVTAILLLGTALYFLVASQSLDIAMLKQTLMTASWAGIGISFLT
jgi:hypothetical protein